MVVVVVPDPPDEPLDALLGNSVEEASLEASVVVVVVVCCAKPALADLLPNLVRNGHGICG